jgi:hypothetical protein
MARYYDWSCVWRKGQTALLYVGCHVHTCVQQEPCLPTASHRRAIGEMWLSARRYQRTTSVDEAGVCPTWDEACCVIDEVFRAG